MSGRGSWGSRLDAVTGSVATTTARQWISPPSVTTTPGPTERVRALTSSWGYGSGPAIAAGRAAMPAAGTPMRPRANERRIIASTWLEVSRARSAKTPDRNGRSTSSIIRCDRPALRSASCGGRLRGLEQALLRRQVAYLVASAANFSRSASVPTPEFRVCGAAIGSRSGFSRRCSAPPRRTSTPGVK